MAPSQALHLPLSIYNDMARRGRQTYRALPTAHPLRVAVDGIDAAGKVTLADELAE